MEQYLLNLVLWKNLKILRTLLNNYEKNINVSYVIFKKS